MAYQGWLTLGGQEIINRARLSAYVNNLAPGAVRDCDCDCENLHELLGDAPYTTPLNDDAPWADPGHGASQDFLGVLPLDFQGLEDSSRETPYVQLISDGGAVTGRRSAAKEVRFKALLVGRTEEGVDHGFTWLNNALRGSVRGECGPGDDMCWFTSCPQPGLAGPLVELDLDLRPKETIFGAQSLPGVSGWPHVDGSGSWDGRIFTARRPSEVDRTNYALNPAMRATSGEVLVATNQATNPSFETVETNGRVRLQGATGGASTGGSATQYRSDEWSASGGYSVCIDASTSTTGATALYPAGQTGAMSRFGWVPGGTYRVTATLHITESLSGPQSEWARAIFFGTTVGGVTSFSAARTASSPNAPGTYEHSLAVTVPSDAENAFIRLMHGGQEGKVWWDNLIITEGPAYVPYFDGDTPDDDTFTYRWTGTPHESTSEKVARRIANAQNNGADGTLLDHYQSVDPDGRTWLRPLRRDGEVGSGGNRVWAPTAELGYFTGSVVVRATTPEAVGQSVRVTLHSGKYLTPSNFTVTLTAEPQTVTLTSGTSRDDNNGDLYVFVYPVTTDDYEWTDALAVRVPGPGLPPGGYFDGNTPDSPVAHYEWAGTPNESSSLELGYTADPARLVFPRLNVSSICAPITWHLDVASPQPARIRASLVTDVGTVYDQEVDVGPATTTVFIQDNGQAQAWAEPQIEFLSSGIGELHIPRARLTYRRDATPFECADDLTRRLRGVYAIEGPKVIKRFRTNKASFWEVEFTIGAMTPWRYTLETPILDSSRRFLDPVYPNARVRQLSSTVPECIEERAISIVDPACPTLPPPPRVEPPDPSCYEDRFRPGSGFSTNAEVLDELGVNYEPDAFNAPRPVSRTYLASIPSSAIPRNKEAVPVIRAKALGSNPVRRARVRFIRSPWDWDSVENLDPCSVCGDFTIDYIPAGATFTIDGMREDAYVTLAGGDVAPAGHLLSGPSPVRLFNWPTLVCSGYVMVVDVEDSSGVAIDMSLATRE